MRLIVFGAPDDQAALLERDDVRAGVAELLATGSVRESPAADVIAARLFDHRDGAWVAGPRLLVPGEEARARSVAAGGACAELLAGRMSRLRAAYGAGAAHEWPAVALLVVGGLLLDLFVGQALVEGGMVRPPGDGWRAWALPPADLAVGMRVRYAPGGGVGCGVMWVGGMRDRAVLLADEELGRIAAGGADRRPEWRLRLRYLGWLDGDRPGYLFARSTDRLWGELRETARLLVAGVHRPRLEQAPERDDAHAVLAHSRMAFEHALGQLLRDGVLPPVRDGNVRRLVWTGPDWDLRAASAPVAGHDGG